MADQKLKIVFLSSIAVPQQIKMCYALQDFFEAEFWFYESPDRTRGKWWRVDLGDRCRLLGNVWFRESGPLAGRYWVPDLNKKLTAYNPDIVMLGGFSIPSNFLAYLWARSNGKRTIVFTERSRDKSGALRRLGLTWRVLRWLYRNVDVVMTSAEDAVEQFRDEFGFGEKVVAGRYAADLDVFFHHGARNPKSAYTYLFANRMTEIYNPLGTLEIFADVSGRHPGSKLLMNAAGEMRKQCEERIGQLGISHAVEFLTAIQSWEELHNVYARSDILILPAKFSNGNYTILEAMASGMGVVVSNRVLGIGQMIHDGENGFNCEPTTVEFVKRIEEYIGKPELFRDHAQINRQMVKPLSTHGTAEFFSKIVHKKLRL